MTKSRRKAERDEAVAMITLLEERFPACFAVLERRRRPLKIAIHQDIIAAVGVPPDELGRALRRYTQADGNCARLKPGAARIDVDGRAAGVVTEDEAKLGQERLAKRKARLARQARTHCGCAERAEDGCAPVGRETPRGRAPARTRRNEPCVIPPAAPRAVT